MTIDVSDTRFHKVFLVEAEGDTLIVSPTGEACEFRHSLILDETNTILKLLMNLECQVGEMGAMLTQSREHGTHIGMTYLVRQNS